MTREELIYAVYRRVRYIPEHERICADYIDALQSLWQERHGDNMWEMYGDD